MQDSAIESGTQRVRLEHPYVVLRVAGLPAQDVTRLGTGRSRAFLDRSEDVRAKAAASVADACAELEAAIADTALDQAQRRALLEVKRRLYNFRNVSEERAASLPPRVRASVERAAALVGECARRESDFAQTYAEEQSQVSVSLRQLALEDDNFLRALAFSAQSLAADILSLHERPEKFVGKAGRQLDLGLFNFLIRAITKVSPFTYFTPVLPARWVDSSVSLPLNAGDRPVVPSVEMSRHVFHHVLSALIRKPSLLPAGVRFRVNPTLRSDGTALSFDDVFARGPSNERTWGVHAPRVTLPASPRINALCAAFRGSDASARELFAACNDVFEGSPQIFERFLEKAVQVGLVVPELAFFEQQDAESFIESLIAKSAPGTQAFRALRDGMVQYAVAAPQKRLSYEARCAADVATLLESLNIETPVDPKASLFYEDCRIGTSPLDVPRGAFSRILDDLHSAGGLFPILDYNTTMQSVFGAMFVRRYGRGTRVAASVCVEELCRDAVSFAQRVSFLPLAEQERELAPLSEDAAAVVALRRELLADLYERMRDRDQVELGDADISRYVDRLPDAVRNRPWSYNVIGQTVGYDDPLFVVNRLYSGHSMLLSRFVRGIEETGLREIEAYLQELSPEHLLIELPGVFGFNANLHPRFVGAELSMPGRPASYAETLKVQLDDLLLSYDEGVDRIVAHTKQGTPVALHYFGFLNIMVLPNAYQMLGRLHLQGLIPDVWQQLHYSGYISPNEFVALGRLTHGSVVLGRRTALMPHGLLGDVEQPTAQFYRELYTQLRRAGFDGEQFVRLVPTLEDLMPSGPEPSDVTTTAFKPAYLNFDVPLSVSTLQRRLQKRRRAILSQEALPRVGDGAVTWNGRGHVHEIQFEIGQRPLV